MHTLVDTFINDFTLNFNVTHVLYMFSDKCNLLLPYSFSISQLPLISKTKKYKIKIRIIKVKNKMINIKMDSWGTCLILHIIIIICHNFIAQKSYPAASTSCLQAAYTNQ